jgi:hypothetical protein
MSPGIVATPIPVFESTVSVRNNSQCFTVRKTRMCSTLYTSILCAQVVQKLRSVRLVLEEQGARFD